MTFSEEVQAITEEVATLLVQKNQRYGDSALNPKRIFSKADPVQGILIRIDDKLSRISNLGIGENPDEDTLADLIGYLVILKIHLRRQHGQEKP